jgi:hypothetical protein
MRRVFNKSVTRSNAPVITKRASHTRASFNSRRAWRTLDTIPEEPCPQLGLTLPRRRVGRPLRPGPLAMRLRNLRSWFHYLLACAALVFVVAGWFVALSAAAMRRPRLQLTSVPPSLRFGLHLGAALFVTALVVVWFVVAITYPFLIPVAFSSVPVLIYSLLVVAQGSPYPRLPEQPAPMAACERPRVSWLSSLASWRLSSADHTPGRDGFGDRDLVREHVYGLVQDWLTSNGWKYRLVGVWLPSRKTVSPFGAVPEWWKVYQIALEDPSGLVEYGSIRFGDGRVEFRFEADGPRHGLVVDPFETNRLEPVFPPEPMPVPVGPDPLWDRWLDG